MDRVTLCISLLLLCWLPSPLKAEEIPDHRAARFDFELVDAWEGLSTDVEPAKQGDHDGLWGDTIAVTRIRNRSFPRDVSNYMGFRIWIRSAKATGARIAFVLVSENGASEGADYYFSNVMIDWTGWKEVEVPFDTMKVRREPVGLASIDELKIASTDFDCGKEATPGTVLAFDDLRLIPRAPAPPGESQATPAETTSTVGFEDISQWIGLVADTKDFKEGNQSGVWQDTSAVRRIITTRAIPTDLSGFAGVSMWINSSGITRDRICFIFASDNPATSDMDFYSQLVSIDWEGWKQVRLLFANSRVGRSPLGWDRINELRMASDKYGIGTEPSGMTLKFDGFEFFRADEVAKVQVPPTPIKWHATLAESINTARAQKSLLFIMGYRESVPACVEFEKQVLADPDLGAKLSQYSCFRFDPSTDRETSRYFKVSRVPVVLVYSPEGSELLRVVNQPSPQELGMMLDTIVKNYAAP